MPDIDGSFEVFYRRNYKFVYRVCFLYMKNGYDAEDCTEDVFVKVLKLRPVFNDSGHERAWLTAAAANLCKDRLKHWWKKSVVPVDEAESLPDGKTEEYGGLLDAVMRLPEKYKDIIILYYYQGYNTQETAELLGERPSTVRNRLSRARELLKDELGGDYN